MSKIYFIKKEDDNCTYETMNILPRKVKEQLADYIISIEDLIILIALAKESGVKQAKEILENISSDSYIIVGD